MMVLPMIFCTVQNALYVLFWFHRYWTSPRIFVLSSATEKPSIYPSLLLSKSAQKANFLTISGNNRSSELEPVKADRIVGTGVRMPNSA